MKKEIMGWEQCTNEHIRTVSVDQDKVMSILKMCSIRLRVLKQIKLDDETASIIAEDYYEVIKELLTALLLTKGLKSNNHECLISFFKKSYSEKEYEIKLIHELKSIRNKISYEGLFVEKNYLDRNQLEFNHIINFLIREVKSNINKE